VTIAFLLRHRARTVPSHVPVEDRTQPNRDLFPTGSVAAGDAVVKIVRKVSD
jgi:hypothetical protein